MGNDRDDDDDDGIFSCDFRSLSSLEPPHHLCKQTHVVFYHKLISRGKCFYIYALCANNKNRRTEQGTKFHNNSALTTTVQSRILQDRKCETLRESRRKRKSACSCSANQKTKIATVGWV